jgi:hypothetical protein
MPDRELYVPCGNRRVCPACSEAYRADTYQVVKAGLAGGKGVPLTVGRHPCVFLTLTAPSFGPVHANHRDDRPCHPRRTPHTCEHGVTVDRHTEDGPVSGRPFCLDCYDHTHQVVWNGFAGELWRRTRNTAVRQLRQLEQRYACRLRLSYAKVAEFQRRGVVHIHAMVRLDGFDRDDPAAVIEPDPRLTSGHLADLMRSAVWATAFTTPPHPDRGSRAAGQDQWGSALRAVPVRDRARNAARRAARAHLGRGGPRRWPARGASVADLGSWWSRDPAAKDTSVPADHPAARGGGGLLSPVVVKPRAEEGHDR